MKLLRLQGRKVNNRVLLQGTLWRGKTLNVRWASGVPLPVWQKRKDDSPQGFYLGTFASAKLDKSAVKRNRMRRRCKEAFRRVFREEKQEWPSRGSFQLLLSPRSSSLTCAFEDILKDVRLFLSLLRSSWPKAPPQSEEASSSSR